MSCLGTNEHAT